MNTGKKPEKAADTATQAPQWRTSFLATMPFSPGDGELPESDDRYPVIPMVLEGGAVRILEKPPTFQFPV